MGGPMWQDKVSKKVLRGLSYKKLSKKDVKWVKSFPVEFLLFLDRFKH